MKSYQQTLDYLYSQLPMFTRVGAAALKADLTNTIALCNVLDNPQHKFRSVHIGGTNGKGSTSHMLAAILQVAGYKTGLYTSPHLTDFRERIRINGQMISEETVVGFVNENLQAFEDIQPSFFEMTVAMAFDTFVKQKVDIAIVEVGLGGRLDSTNVITPLLSVITNIGWDHMNILGNSLEQIAFEKAGIIKPNIPVIIGEYQAETAGIFKEVAKQRDSSIRFASEEWNIQLDTVEQSMSGNPNELLTFSLKNTSENQESSNSTELDIELDLIGIYQLKNVKAVLSAVEELRRAGFSVSDDHIKTALRQVKLLTELHGRWEILSKDPLIICDTGHNVDGIKEVLKNIATTPYNKLHFVIGMVNDKDLSKVLGLLPQKAVYYFCKPDIPRGLDAELLRESAMNFRLTGNAYPSVKTALDVAKQNAGNGDLVFIGGSTFVVAEVV
jgi:dihydrofolate synthase/folylpolyglutamate synthase